MKINGNVHGEESLIAAKVSFSRELRDWSKYFEDFMENMCITITAVGVSTATSNIVDAIVNIIVTIMHITVTKINGFVAIMCTVTEPFILLLLKYTLLSQYCTFRLNSTHYNLNNVHFYHKTHQKYTKKCTSM